MLLELSVRNFALIDEIRMEFTRGLNVLTGETGAGKSMLVDAVRLALGGRLEPGQVRDKSAPCVAEAVFSLSGPGEFYTEGPVRQYLADGDDYLVFRREIFEGRSKNYINGQFVNLSAVREIGDSLIDFHGQYDHQKIFELDTHRRILDKLAGLEGAAAPVLESYQALYGEYTALKAEQKDWMQAMEGRERELDLLSFQIGEIEKVRPGPDEEEKLGLERIRLAQAEKLFAILAELNAVLDEEEHSLSARLGEVSRLMARWSRIDPSAGALQSEMETAQLNLEEMMRSVQDYRDSLSFDPERLEEIDNRLSRMETLKKKYGGTIREVLDFLAEAKKRYDQLLNSEIHQRDLEQKIARLLPGLEQKAHELRRLRKKAAQSLVRTVERQLRELGIRHARFDCRLSPVEAGKWGMDHVEFFISPNPGVDLMPLAQIASGGEAARTILALKHAVMGVDASQTLVFDEIDSNIGGRLGSVVGKKLKEISQDRQVILMTHLPQIASFADRHFKVVKVVEKGRTRVAHALLDGEDKVKELAQMMSGENETAISKSHAKEMLKTAARE